MTSHFSFQRLLLILVWIGVSAGIILLNSYLFPHYNHESVFLLISLLCLINAVSILTGLLGINKKVSKHEDLQWHNYVIEAHKEEFEQIKRQIRFQQTMAPEQTEQDLLLEEFNKKMDQAKMTWRLKQKSELNAFENFFKIEQSLSNLNVASKICSILLSLATGFMILNISSLPTYYFMIYGILIVCMIFFNLQIRVFTKSNETG